MSLSQDAESPVLRFVQSRARRAQHALLGATLAQTAVRLGFAAALAVFAGTMIGAGQLNRAALAMAVLALASAALLGLHAATIRTRAEAAVAGDLRRLIAGQLAGRSCAQVQAEPASALVAGIERHPGQIARLVVGHQVNARMMAAGPLLAAVAIAVVSWQAALALVLATPVMVVFFVLAGGMIHDRAAQQEQALGLLAAQFGDRVRTLPTILANQALLREQAKLQTRMRIYSDATMAVLRLAFVNAAIIDFFASLSIAMLAVFLGLGHLGLVHLPGFSGLQLWQSLFILMLAPEYFAPFRRFAEGYHTKAEGHAAALALDRFLAAPSAGVRLARVDAAVAAALALPLPMCGLIAVTGPSGVGKSTLLRALAGLEPGLAVPPLALAPCWVSGEVPLPSGTIADAIADGLGEVALARLRRAAHAAGLTDDPHLPGGLVTQIGVNGEALSGGQRMRIAAARALLGDGAILADEPTAKLDAASAEHLRRALIEAARHRLVVAATHDPALMRMAHRVIAVDSQPSVREQVA